MILRRFDNRSFLCWILCVPTSLALLYAGAAKALGPQQFADSTVLLGMPPVMASYLALAMPGIEIGCGVALLVTARNRLVRRVVLGLLIVLTGFLASQTTSEVSTCACFGSDIFLLGPETWSGAILRNLALAGLVAISLVLMRPTRREERHHAT